MDSGTGCFYVDTLSGTKIPPAVTQWGQYWTADLEAESWSGLKVCGYDYNITVGWGFKRLKN